MVYEPSSDEFLLVGTLGLGLYSLLSILVMISFRRGNRNEMTFYFFICMLITCIFELPRFVAMVITRDYSSRIGYIFHILAGVAFFAGFSCVCYQWKGLLKLGTYSTLMYSARGIVMLNIIFGCIEVIAIFICAAYETLDDYFRSISFEAFTFVDALKNVVFAGFLSYYGLRLISRFWRFRKADASLSSGHTKSVFSVALHRLTTALTVATICFLLRVTMLTMKMIVLHSSVVVTNKKFKLFGLVWFAAADFIPRCLPLLAFVALMMYSRRSTGADMNKEFLNQPARELQAQPFDEYRQLSLSEGHAFLGDNYSPRTAYAFYEDLAYFEDEDYEAEDQANLDALSYMEYNSHIAVNISSSRSNIGPRSPKKNAAGTAPTAPTGVYTDV